MSTDSRFTHNNGLKIITRRRVFWLINSFLFILFSLLLIFTIRFFKYSQKIPSEHLIGNKASSLKALKEKGFPFSFLVISDTHNSNQGEALLKMALKESDASFLIHVGDFVNDSSLWDHRFFLTNMIEEIKPSFPVFLAPGNHDIDYTSHGKKQNERRVTPEIYESLYGSRSFDFIFNNCLFIICEVDLRNPASYLNDLQDILSKKGKGRKHIFVFRHYPLKGLVDYKGSSLPHEEKFFNLVESYEVTTCFFGHYHGYRRGQTKGINMIVLGGGGGRLKSWQPKWGKFHHLLKITVNENIIIEDMLTLQGKVGNFSRTYKKWVFIHLFPIIENRSWVLYFGVILFLSWSTYSVICLVNSFKKKRGWSLKYELKK
jgi:predicted phosphodiesterase